MAQAQICWNCDLEIRFGEAVINQEGIAPRHIDCVCVARLREELERVKRTQILRKDPLWRLTDPAGTLFFVEMISVCKSKGEYVVRRVI